MQTLNNIGQLLVQVLWAVVVLFVGWIIAKVVAALVGKLLHWLKLDERLGKAAGETKVPPLEKLLTLVAYYLILLFAVIAALQVLGLTIVTQPLNAMLNAIFAYIPMLDRGRRGDLHRVAGGDDSARHRARLPGIDQDGQEGRRCGRPEGMAAGARDRRGGLLAGLAVVPAHHLCRVRADGLDRARDESAE